MKPFSRARPMTGSLFNAARSPRLALMVGGTNVEHELTVDHARRMGEEVAALANREGGSVLVTTSRRTPRRAADALEASLGDTCYHFHRWDDAENDGSANPYLGYLALADALIVTGESASMLAEACATRKPVYIYPLPRRSPGIRAWCRGAGRILADTVWNRAWSKPLSRRDIEKPQRGLRRFCAGLLARGIVRPGRHGRRLHELLVDRGLARIFDGTLSAGKRSPVRSSMGGGSGAKDDGPRVRDDVLAVDDRSRTEVDARSVGAGRVRRQRLILEEGAHAHHCAVEIARILGRLDTGCILPDPHRAAAVDQSSLNRADVAPKLTRP